MEAVQARLSGRVIGVQMRQARECGALTLESDHGRRTKTHAYMTLVRRPAPPATLAICWCVLCGAGGGA